MLYTVKSFGIINEAIKERRLLEFSAFLRQISEIADLVSCPSSISEPCLFWW